MSKKTVAFKMPTPAPKPTTPDEWVGSARPLDRERPAPEAEAPKEATSRFTIDVPVSLHRRVKAQCAERGVKMADVIRELLEREFTKS
jgi:hypothetical protein